MSEAHVQLDMSSPVLDSPGLLYISWAFADQPYFCLTVLFTLLSFELLGSKTFLKVI